LTLKESKFLKAYLETGNISESAKRAGSKGKDVFSLYETGRRWLDKIGISLQETQEALGITDAYLTKKLSEGLTANKRYFGTWQGEIVSSDEFEDYVTRSKYLEIAHRLRGQFVDRHELTGKDGGDISISYAPSKIGKKHGRALDL
jgi:phage terminase small subunit